MRNWKGTIALLLLLAASWLLIVSSVAAAELIAGAVAIVVIVLLTHRSRDLLGGLRMSLKALLFTPIYLMVFLWQLIRSNLDIARRVLSPSLPINPGIVKVQTQLQSPMGKLILANSITLTPGTLTLDVEGNSLFVHWVDVKGSDVNEATQAIVAGFERTLMEVVE
jgi:multicomponent Na+:H+ antiporter subunit E